MSTETKGARYDMQGQKQTRTLTQTLASGGAETAGERQKALGGEETDTERVHIQIESEGGSRETETEGQGE